MPEYHNPQQQPGNERRLLLVFAVTFIVLLAAQPLMKRFFPPPPAPATQQQQQPVQPPAAQLSAPDQMQAVAPAPTTPASGVQAQSEEETVVENDVFRVTFTNRGAIVKSWVLKKYNDDHGKPLELVHPTAAAIYGYPLSMWTYDQGVRDRLNSVLYVPSTTGQVAAPNQVSFEYADNELVVRKSFRFDNSYVLRAETSVYRNGQLVQAYPAWPSGFGDQTVAPSYAAATIVYHPGDEVRRQAVNNVSGGATLAQPMHYAGVSDQYFSAVFLPEQTGATALITLRNSIEIPKNLNKPKPDEKIRVEVLGAAVGNPAGPTSQRLFVGPKAVDVVESIQANALPGQSATPNLGGLVDFGKWFGFIARPLFLWLKWTQEHWIPNWGWAIAFLTLIINLAMLPLRLTQMKSGLKMQKLAPQMKAIQSKYKAKMQNLEMRDPRRREIQAQQNSEVMALYKQNKVNPAGGCLPLLLQFPFLVAFYSMLSVALELRHAKWLWVKDLAAPDPFYILPVAIVVSTFAMQKMTPTGGMDPAQQKMLTWMMPVMIGFFSFSVASGLGLYWLVGTVIAIVQQMVMNRTSLGQEIRTEAEKRNKKPQAAR